MELPFVKCIVTSVCSVSTSLFLSAYLTKEVYLKAAVSGGLFPFLITVLREHC